jgi:hypothetical protein
MRFSAKRTTALLISLSLVILLMQAPLRAQSGGSLDLRSNVIAGGGNTSTGSGNLQISGTVGQPAAGTLTSGGSITQRGGFWAAILGVPTPTPTPSPGAGTLQFSAANFNGNEGCAGATITITRTNGSTGAVTVDFDTSDSTATQLRDYSIASATITFADAEISKNVEVLLTKDAYFEGNETLNLTLSNPTGGAVLGAQTSATLTIIDDSSVPLSSQPIDDASTFVCQHYHDFLARTPDGGGAAFWTSLITQCGSDQTCIRNKRIDVSNAFFYELEFQQTGAYVFRLYRAAFGNNQPFPNPDNSNQTEARKLPGYNVFAHDRARVVGGSSLAQGQLDLANAFVQRPQFLSKYPAGLDGPGFVDAVLATVNNELGVDLAGQRTALIALFNSSGRGAVLYRLADDNAGSNPINNRAFIDEEYNRAFVATQYFGYLRRDADIGGFLFWLSQVNGAPLRDTSKQHAMVCAFITSTEYQQRFSAIATHSNGECP